MEYLHTEIPDVVVLQPKVFGDERGFFLETFRADEFARNCGTVSFVQDNHSGSRRGILRGLHYQIQQPQGKLVRAVAGTIFDVAVDIRKGSSTFGKWVGEVISAENRRQIWIPAGFAHGFYVISDWAEVFYKATDYYAPAYERSILWDDPDLAIRWPLTEGQSPILSEKDKAGKRLSEAEVYDLRGNA